MNPAVKWLEDRFDQRWRVLGRVSYETVSVLSYRLPPPNGSVTVASMFTLKDAVVSGLSCDAAHWCETFGHRMVLEELSTDNFVSVYERCDHGFGREYAVLRVLRGAASD